MEKLEEEANAAGMTLTPVSRGLLKSPRKKKQAARQVPDTPPNMQGGGLVPMKEHYLKKPIKELRGKFPKKSKKKLTKEVMKKAEDLLLQAQPLPPPPGAFKSNPAYKSANLGKTYTIKPAVRKIPRQQKQRKVLAIRRPPGPKNRKPATSKLRKNQASLVARNTLRRPKKTAAEKLVKEVGETRPLALGTLGAVGTLVGGLAGGLLLHGLVADKAAEIEEEAARKKPTTPKINAFAGLKSDFVRSEMQRMSQASKSPFYTSEQVRKLY